MGVLSLRYLCAFVCLLWFTSAAWGQTAEERYDHHFEMGNRAQTAWRHQEALAHYTAAIEALRQIPGGVERSDRLFYNQALAMAGTGKIAEAIEVWKVVESWREKNLGQSHPENIQVVRVMATRYQQLLDSQNSFTYALHTLRLTERHYGAQANETAEACMSHALVLMRWFDSAEVDKLLARSLAILEANLGKRSFRLREPLEMLSLRALERGEYRQSEALLERCKTLEPYKAINEINRLTALMSGRVMWTHLYQTSGRFLEAEAVYHEQLAMSVQRDRLQPKTNSGDLAGIYGNMGTLYLEMGLPDKALEHFKLAVTGLERAGESDSYEMGFTLHGIAKVHYLRGELEDALKVYQEARRGKNRRLAALPPQYAAVLRDLGKFKEAAEFLEESSASTLKRMGKRNAFYLQILEEQAGLEAAQGRGESAHKLYQQVIDTIGPSPGNADVAAAQLGQARLALTAGERAQAIALADKSRRELRRFARRVLPALGEYEQLEFLANREARSLQESLAMALDQPDDRSAMETAASWILNAKGLAQESFAQRTLEARETTDPRQAADLRDWLAVRYRLAKLSLADGVAKPLSDSDQEDIDSKKQERELAALSAREQVLAKQLGRSSLREQSDPWVDLAAVRAKIPAETVLIEFARSVPPKAKAPANAAPAKYLAWVIPPAGHGEVKLVDLGPCAAIDAAIAAARKPLLAAREAILDVGEAEAEKALQKELAALSAKLLDPLRPYVASSRHWILSPDGNLWLVPWSALLVEKDKYLVESHATSLVVSGRDLVELAGRKASGNPSLVLADPDFDLSESASKPGEAPSQAPLAAADDRRTQATRSAAVRSAVSTSWQRLPGTAQEAKELEPKLAAYTGSTIDLRTGRDASETAIRDAWQPRVAVLSTHGYFLDRSPESGSTTLQSPLVRCGLVLAGANRRATAASDSPDDGILTGLEIIGADLRGTELVVLSACETALGEVRAAEGVAGLRQAFQLAGAQSVLASLWRVPDADTAQLMVDFYERLAATGDKSVAIREAQLALLDRHRKTTKSGHPYYWGAFTLTGRTDRPEVTAAKPRPTREVIRPRVRVISATAPVMDGTAQVAVVRQGDSLEVTGEQGEWLLVPVAGQPKPGWILKRHVQVIE